MNFFNRLFGNNGPNPDLTNSEPAPMGMGYGWLEGIGRVGQWDELAAEIGQESQGRVALVGLPGAGKSLLFNRLRGWVISRPGSEQTFGSSLQLEFYGSFLLGDLPVEGDPDQLLQEDVLLAVGDPALVVYLIDGTRGVQPADFRWVARIRAGGRPLVTALNKCDLLPDSSGVLQDAQHRLGMPVIPISAHTGDNVAERLLPAMLDAAPKLAVTLGREIAILRRQAARRVIRQASLLTGLMSAQPLPGLDLPFQAMVQCGVVMRVGAAYGHPPAGGLSRELIGTVAGGLSLHYLAQTLVKLVPVLGWAVSAALGAGATLLIGEAAIRYFEAGGTIPLHVPRPHLARPQWPRRRTRPQARQEKASGWPNSEPPATAQTFEIPVQNED